MFTKIRISGALIMLLCGLMLQPCVYAQPGQAQQAASEEDAEVVQPVEDRKTASELARKKHEGRVLNVKLVEGVWRVRMDHEGTVFDVHVNADTGKVSLPE